MKLKHSLIALFLTLGLAGCVNPTQTPPSAYIKADRATLEGMKPIGDIAKQANPFLAPDIDRKFESWEDRVEKAENGIYPVE
jgi:PBP1b-binding outer membrane lipoprotein LpoB